MHDETSCANKIQCIISKLCYKLTILLNILIVSCMRYVSSTSEKKITSSAQWNALSGLNTTLSHFQ
jgi:hypothetical protein